MDCKSGKVRRALLYLLVLIGGATGVKNLEMIVPAMVRSGDSALLTCRYDLETAPLYKMHWYLNDQEFYRYVPKAHPPQMSFRVQGIEIDAKYSNMNDVALRNVSRELTGMYKCEVSEEAPSYHTGTQQQRMEVAETDPVIVVERQRLPAGETLRANCTSGTSHPGPNVTWTLNGDPLDDAVKTWTHTNTRDNMEYTWSILEVKVSNRMFQEGRIRLRCFANISGIYTATAEIDVNEDKPLIASITGDAAPHSNPSRGVRSGRLATFISSEGLARVAIVVGGLIVPTASFR